MLLGTAAVKQLTVRYTWAVAPLAIERGSYCCLGNYPRPIVAKIHKNIKLQFCWQVCINISNLPKDIMMVKPMLNKQLEVCNGTQTDQLE